MAQQFQVPFTGSYNTRITSKNVTNVQSGIIGIGVVGSFIIGLKPSFFYDERFINCFMTDMGGRKYIVKRSGFAASITPSPGNIGTAILIWTGNGNGIITAFGGVNSTLYNGVTSLGAITGKATFISETFVGATPTLVVPSSDSTGWYYDTTVMTKITDVNFPGNAGKTLVGNFCHLDGYAFIMDSSGALWNSNLNTVTAWSALGFVSANSYPDKGIGCIRYKNYIMAFGTESVQFFYNTNNAVGSPLNRVEQLTIKVGAINANSIAQISDVVFWIGGTAQGGLTAYMYNGSIQRISNPEHDYQFITSVTGSISMTTHKNYGRSFVTILAGSQTYVYCLEDKAWHQLESPVGIPALWYKSSGISAGFLIVSYFISNVSTSGKVYVIDPTNLTYKDDGNVYTAIFQSANDDSGTSYRKAYNQLRVDADIESSSSPMTVRYTDDDYSTFTNAGTIDLSSQSYLSRLGSSSSSNGNKRAWRFEHSANTPFRVRKVEGLVTLGYR